MLTPSAFHPGQPRSCRKKLLEQGVIPSPGSPDAFRALILADSKKFAQIIRDVGIPMEG